MPGRVLAFDIERTKHPAIVILSAVEGPLLLA